MWAAEGVVNRAVNEASYRIIYIQDTVRQESGVLRVNKYEGRGGCVWGGGV